MSEETHCTESHGFLPCSDHLGGSISLMFIYGYILLQGANLLADGSEMLLQILHPGIIGGLVLPVLGALPDTLIILVAGYGIESPEKAAEEVKVGIGTLAGSTVMLLTLAYGGGILLGRCDRDKRGFAIEKVCTKNSLIQTGVTTEKGISGNAIIMAVSTLLYLTIQVPAWIGYHDERLPALIGCVLCVVALLAYCAYQVVVPSLQSMKIEAANSKAHRFMAISRLTQLATSQYGALVDSEGNVNHEAVAEIFNRFDTDQNGNIDGDELYAMIVGLELATASSGDAAKNVQMWLKEFDLDQGGTVSLDEFQAGVQRWIREKLISLGAIGDVNQRLMADEEQPLLEEEEPRANDDGDDEEHHFEAGDAPLTVSQVICRSVTYMACGAFVCGFFADPMVEAVTTFASAAKLDPFLVAFVVTPFASNASELVSSLKFATKKRVKNISLTFGQVYGAVTMNNTMCLAMFLFVVYKNELEWKYTAKVLGTIVPTIIVGIIGSTGRHFQAIWAIPILALYPIALASVYFLDRLWGTF